MTTYSYNVSMTGFESVSGIHTSTRSHDAEVAAIKHFLAANNMDDYDGNMSELIRFYAPDVRIASDAQLARWNAV